MSFAIFYRITQHSSMVYKVWQTFRKNCDVGKDFFGEKCLLMHTPRLQLYPSIILSFMDSEVYTESEKTSKCF